MQNVMLSYRITPNSIEFITAAQVSAGNTRIKLEFDKTKIAEMPSEFTFLDNPVVTGISNFTVLASGGTSVTLIGQNMHANIKPMMVLKTAKRVGDGRRKKRQVEVNGVQGDNTPAYVLTDLSEIKVVG